MLTLVDGRVAGSSRSGALADDALGDAVSELVAEFEVSLVSSALPAFSLLEGSGSDFSSGLVSSAFLSSEEPDAALASPMRAMTDPTSTVSSSSARTSTKVPATGDGISVSTLSVDTSNSGSSTSTSSPTFLSHWVMVPSVTDSPSSGISTSVAPPEVEPLEPESEDFCDCSPSEELFSSGSESPASESEDSDAPLSSLLVSSPSSPISAMTSPTSTVSSSSAIIFVNTPATGEGISVSTLSVETSRSGSSTATVSPTCLSHVVTVPSVTDSPSSGISTENAMVEVSSKISDS